MIGQKLLCLRRAGSAGGKPPSALRLAVTAAALAFGATAHAAVPVSPGHATAAPWPAGAAHEALLLDRPADILDYAATAATMPEHVTLPERLEATVQGAGFMPSVEIILALIVALIVAVDRRRIVASFGTLGNAAAAGLVGVARMIVQFAEEPLPQPRRVRAFEPLLRLAEPVHQTPWPAMSRISDDRRMPARAYGFEHGRPAAAAAQQVRPPVLARYCFYTFNQWGIVDCRTDHSFANDAAALLHARQSAGSSPIEVWRDGRSIGTVSGNAAATDKGSHEYA